MCWMRLGGLQAPRRMWARMRQARRRIVGIDKRVLLIDERDERDNDRDRMTRARARARARKKSKGVVAAWNVVVVLFFGLLFVHPPHDGPTIGPEGCTYFQNPKRRYREAVHQKMQKTGGRACATQPTLFLLCASWLCSLLISSSVLFFGAFQSPQSPLLLLLLLLTPAAAAAASADAAQKGTDSLFFAPH